MADGGRRQPSRTSSIGKRPRMNMQSDRKYKHSVINQLREIIDSRGLSGHAVGKLAGVDPGVVQRFFDRTS